MNVVREQEELVVDIPPHGGQTTKMLTELIEQEGVSVLSYLHGGSAGGLKALLITDQPAQSESVWKRATTLQMEVTHAQ